MTGTWSIDAELRTEGMAIVLMTHGATGPLARTHRMDEHTISLFLTPDIGDAQGRYRLGERPTRFGRFGALSLIPADIPLSVRATGAPKRRLVSCRFDRERFERATGLGTDWDDNALAACLDVRGARIKAGLERLAREAESPGFASALMVEGLGITLMAEIARYLHGLDGSGPGHKGGLAPWQLARITDAVDALPAPPNLTELARLCGLGSRHLMRGFRQSTGMTITDYATDIRMRRAVRFLSDTALPMGDIATQLGFASQSAFTRAFRRATGETPSSFRRRLG